MPPTTTTTAGPVVLADLADRRQAAGLTQTKLALAARCSPETIRRIEAGFSTSSRLAERIELALAA